MTSPHDLLTRLGSLADDDLPVLDVALALGALHRPQGDGATAQDEVDRLTTEVNRLLPGDPAVIQIADSLADILVRRCGFTPGDDDSDGHEMCQLLSQGRASQDSIALLWLGLARRAGLCAEMLSFPMHCLVRLSDGTGARVIVECTDGRILDAASLRMLHKMDAGPTSELDNKFFIPLSARHTLLRWRQSLKLYHLRQGRLRDALGIVESCLLFAPAHAPLWREAGLMRLRLEDLPGAAAALEQFIQREDNALARGKGQQLLAEIRARMN